MSVKVNKTENTKEKLSVRDTVSHSSTKDNKKSMNTEYIPSDCPQQWPIGTDMKTEKLEISNLSRTASKDVRKGGYKVVSSHLKHTIVLSEGNISLWFNSDKTTVAFIHNERTFIITDNGTTTINSSPVERVITTNGNITLENKKGQSFTLRTAFNLVRINSCLSIFRTQSPVSSK